MQEQTPRDVTTEVTSVAQEEQRTGQKVHVPSPEELNAKAGASFIGCTQALQNILGGIKSNKRLVRVFMAILDLPQEGMSLKNFTKEERVAFELGQRAINDRFIMMQYHIGKEHKIRKQVLEFEEQQKKALSELESSGASEKELEDLKSQHKESLATYENILRGELPENEANLG